MPIESIAGLTEEEEIYWLALKLVPGLGTRTVNKPLERFRTPQAAFRASRTELETAGASGPAAQAIASGGCTFEDAATQQEKTMEAGIVATTVGVPCFRQPMRGIFDPQLRSSRWPASSCCTRSL